MGSLDAEVWSGPPESEPRAAAAPPAALATGEANDCLDPTLMADGTALTAIYVNAGVRSFAEFARIMITDMGPKARRYLLAWWHGAAAQGVDGEMEDVTRAQAAAIMAQILDELGEGAQTRAAPAVFRESRNGPQDLRERASLLVDSAQAFALTLHDVVAAQCPIAGKVDTDQWNFFVTVASAFFAVSRLNDVPVNDAHNDELRGVVEKCMAVWDSDADAAFDDCMDFFERAYQQLVRAGHPPQFIACDALGKWIVWNLLSNPPTTDEHVRLVRVVGGTVVSSFRGWWSETPKQRSAPPGGAALAKSAGPSAQVLAARSASAAPTRHRPPEVVSPTAATAWARNAPAQAAPAVSPGVSALRWVALLPAAVVGSALAYWGLVIVGRITMGSGRGDPDSTVGRLATEWSASLGLGATFVYIAVQLAPAHKRWVARSSACLLLFLGGAFFLAGFMRSAYLAMFADICMLVGGLGMAYDVVHRQLPQDPD